MKKFVKRRKSKSKIRPVQKCYAWALDLDTAGAFFFPPHEMQAWHLAVCAGAIEWVERPNSFGMSQYADCGMMGLEALYRQRMSNYCTNRSSDTLKAAEQNLPFHNSILGRPAAPRDRAHKEPAQRHASVQSTTRLTPGRATQVHTGCESGARTQHVNLREHNTDANEREFSKI